MAQARVRCFVLSHTASCSSFRAVLLLGGRHRQDDVGELADLRAAHLELDGEGGGVQGPPGQVRVGEVVQVDAADDQAAQGPVLQGGEDPDSNLACFFVSGQLINPP